MFHKGFRFGRMHLGRIGIDPERVIAVPGSRVPGATVRGGVLPTLDSGPASQGFDLKAKNNLCRD